MNVVNHVLKGITTYRVTSPFGMRRLTIGGKTIDNMHNGIDLTPRSEIIAIARGRVIKVINGVRESQTKEIIDKAQTSLYYGNIVYLEHANGTQTRYAHLQHGSIPSNIQAGAIVEKGQVLGYMGTTGYSTGVHLHFEVLENGKRVDPAPYLLGQKNVVDFNEFVPINREGLPTLTVNTTNLRIRKTPNGELVGTLPQGSVLPYLGKSSVISGFEWAQVIFEDKIGYCALHDDWNVINHQFKEVIKTVEVIKPVVKPLDETIQKGDYTVRVVIS